MRDSSMPAVIDVTDAALSNGLLTYSSTAPAGRAEDVQPRGYDPRRITEPPARHEEAVAHLDAAHEDLGMLRMGLALGRLRGANLEAALQAAMRAVRSARRAIATGAGVVALALAAVVLVPGATPGAQAAITSPQGKTWTAAPAWAPVYRVVLDRTFVTVRVTATTYNVTPRGQFCASVWGPTSYGQGFIGRACSASPTFTVQVSLDARYVPLGRSTLQITDDAAPLMAAPVAVTLDARRPSRFGVGTYADMGGGQLFVSAPVRHYSPTAGAWLPSKLSPVQVQVWTRRGWRTRGTLTTNTSGLAAGLVTVGGGVHQVRLVRPAGVTVWGTAGRTRIVTVTTEPFDVI